MTARRQNAVLGKRGRSETIAVPAGSDDEDFSVSSRGEENFEDPGGGDGLGDGDGEDQQPFRLRAAKRLRPAALAPPASDEAPRRVRLTSRPIPRSPSRSPSPDPAPATRPRKKRTPAASRKAADQGSARNTLSSSLPPPPPPPPPTPPSSKAKEPSVAVAATARRQNKAKPPTPTPATPKGRTKASESYADRIALDEANRKKWAAERKATPRRRRDRTLKELHCWSLDAARDLPERCIPIPGRSGSARTRRDDDDARQQPSRDARRAVAGTRGGDGEQEADEDGAGEDERDRLSASTVVAQTRAGDVAPKNRTVFDASGDDADGDDAAETGREDDDDDGTRPPPPRGARKSGGGVHGRDDGDARKKRQRRDRETCILSIDFGIVLSFAVILVSPTSLRIVQWQTLRLSEHHHTCEEAAQRAVAYLLTHFQPLPEFDAILLETQPPKKATRTRDMSFAMYGALQSLYARPVVSTSTTPPPPPTPRIVFVDPQLKVNLCYLMGCEATKKGTDNYDHNKNIAEVGCRHLMRSLADRGDVDWAADCERWFLSQATLHDLSDCMLQALAWYHRVSTARTLPHEIVPVNEHTSVPPPPTPKRVAAPKAATTAAKPKLATEKKSTAPRQSAPESKKKATATASSTTISKEVLRAARRANLEPAIVMGKRKMKSERKVPVGSLSASPV